MEVVNCLPASDIGQRLPNPQMRLVRETTGTGAERVGMTALQ
jgi:hypothetical protein